MGGAGGAGGASGGAGGCGSITPVGAAGAGAGVRMATGRGGGGVRTSLGLGAGGGGGGGGGGSLGLGGSMNSLRISTGITTSAALRISPLWSAQRAATWNSTTLPAITAFRERPNVVGGGEEKRSDTIYPSIRARRSTPYLQLKPLSIYEISTRPSRRRRSGCQRVP